MDNELIFQDNNSKILIKFMYKVDRYFTYEIFISTSGYSGKCNFCISDDKLNKYIKGINELMEDLSGEFEIEDCESDAYIKIYFESMRELYVCGQIGGSYQDNYLNFKLKADQTILLRIKDKFLNSY